MFILNLFKNIGKFSINGNYADHRSYYFLNKMKQNKIIYFNFDDAEIYSENMDDISYDFYITCNSLDNKYSIILDFNRERSNAKTINTCGHIHINCIGSGVYNNILGNTEKINCLDHLQSPYDKTPSVFKPYSSSGIFKQYKTIKYCIEYSVEENLLLAHGKIELEI